MKLKQASLSQGLITVSVRLTAKQKIVCKTETC